MEAPLLSITRCCHAVDAKLFTNDLNRVDDPTYIIRLIKKVVTVSVETNEVVGRLEGMTQ